MLARIVPFLVWLHWCAPRVTTHRMRSAKELLTDREVAAGFVLHLLSLSVGAAALGSGSTALLRLFGATLFAAGGAIAWEITTALRRGRTPLGVRVAAG
jgi:hypothetical protein